MNPLDENTTDLEVFAQRLGLGRSDFDLFYEAYYYMDTQVSEDLIEEVLAWEQEDN